MNSLNPLRNKLNLPDYIDIGYLNESKVENHELMIKAKELKIVPRTYDNSLYQNRGTDIIFIYDELKFFCHVDMSD